MANGLGPFFRQVPGLLAQGLRGKRLAEERERERAIEDDRRREEAALRAAQLSLLQTQLRPKPVLPEHEREGFPDAASYLEFLKSKTTATTRPPPPHTPRNIDPNSPEGIAAAVERERRLSQIPTRPSGTPPTQRGVLPTEGERKALAFYRSGKQGYDVLEAVLASGKGVPGFVAQQTARLGMGTGNVLTSGEVRQMRQAALMLSDAWLRYTSGAAVPEQEVERFAESFIPRAGDDAQTLAQKSQARKVIIDALEEAASRAMPSGEGSERPSRPSARDRLRQIRGGQ